jgi:hypothetical protein
MEVYMRPVSMSSNVYNFFTAHSHKTPPKKNTYRKKPSYSSPTFSGIITNYFRPPVKVHSSREYLKIEKKELQKLYDKELKSEYFIRDLVIYTIKLSFNHDKTEPSSENVADNLWTYTKDIFDNSSLREKNLMISTLRGSIVELQTKNKAIFKNTNCLSVLSLNCQKEALSSASKTILIQAITKTLTQLLGLKKLNENHLTEITDFLNDFFPGHLNKDATTVSMTTRQNDLSFYDFSQPILRESTGIMDSMYSLEILNDIEPAERKMFQNFILPTLHSFSSLEQQLKILDVQWLHQNAHIECTGFQVTPLD